MLRPAPRIAVKDCKKLIVINGRMFCEVGLFQCLWKYGALKNGKSCLLRFQTFSNGRETGRQTDRQTDRPHLSYCVRRFTSSDVVLVTMATRSPVPPQTHSNPRQSMCCTDNIKYTQKLIDILLHSVSGSWRFERTQWSYYFETSTTEGRNPDDWCPRRITFD